MNQYEQISITDFKALDPEKNKDKLYLLKGIPRGVIAHDERSNIEKESSKTPYYYLSFYIQESNHVVNASRTVRNYDMGRNEQLLNVASEGDLEISIKGMIENSLNFARLYPHEIIVDGYKLNLDPFGSSK